MKFGLSGEAFGHLIILMVISALIVGATIVYIAHKRKVDITKRRFSLSLGISIVLIFLVIPLWLTDLTIKEKLIVTVLGLSVYIGNNLVLDKMQKVLKEKSGDRKKRENKR